MSKTKMKSQAEIFDAFCLCVDNWLLFNSTFPRVAALLMIRSVLVSSLSVLFFSLCFQHLLKVRYGNNSSLMHHLSSCKMNCSQEKQTMKKKRKKEDRGNKPSLNIIPKSALSVITSVETRRKKARNSDIFQIRFFFLFFFVGRKGKLTNKNQIQKFKPTLQKCMHL